MFSIAHIRSIANIVYDNFIQIDQWFSSVCTHNLRISHIHLFAIYIESWQNLSFILLLYWMIQLMKNVCLYSFPVIYRTMTVLGNWTKSSDCPIVISLAWKLVTFCCVLLSQLSLHIKRKKRFLIKSRSLHKHCEKANILTIYCISTTHKTRDIAKVTLWWCEKDNKQLSSPLSLSCFHLSFFLIRLKCLQSLLHLVLSVCVFEVNF